MYMIHIMNDEKIDSDKNVYNNLVIKQNQDDSKKHVCIVVGGSVDVGKSSFLGVLTTGELDDGRGKARATVAKHPHEIREGKTSDISTRTMCENNRELTLVDLCGHEKYLRTTLFGITGFFPDYGVVIIAANRDILKMTKEHMGILLYMRIPFIIVVTRIDIAPKNIYDETLSLLTKLLKRNKRQVEIINTIDDLDIVNYPDKYKEQEQLSMDKINSVIQKLKINPYIVPVITVSNKTGYFIDPSKYLLTHLEPRKVWNNEMLNGSIFYIESRFTPPGIGLVVSGLTKGNPIKVNSELLIGPYGKEFRKIKAWSLHDNTKNIVKELVDRQRGCIAIKPADKKDDVSKSNIRKGMIIITKGLEQNICYKFTANITILNHSTVISSKYCPVIHCGTIRQSAKIMLAENQEALKTGDDAIVNFRFTQHPEFVEIGNTFFFREGTTRGFGTVKEILPVKDDPDPNPAAPKHKRFLRQRHRQRNQEQRNHDKHDPNKQSGQNPKFNKVIKKLNIEIN